MGDGGGAAIETGLSAQRVAGRAVVSGSTDLPDHRLAAIEDAA
jgi:hypothetical protein